MKSPLRAALEGRRTPIVLASLASLIALGLGVAIVRRAPPAACVSADHACALPSSRARMHAGEAQDLPPGAVLVEFTSVGCPACRSMEPVLHAARTQCAAAGVGAVQLDVDSVGGGTLAAQLNVRATPTLVLFDAEHREASRLVGLRSLADVRKTIEEAFGVACSKTPSAATTGG